MLCVWRGGSSPHSGREALRELLDRTIPTTSSSGISISSNSKPLPLLKNVFCEEIQRAQRMAYLVDHETRVERVEELKEIEGDYEWNSNLLEALSGCSMGRPVSQFVDVSTSLCKHVPTWVACVQPKGMTPRVGQTIRSFSNNLSLLPPTGQIRSYWNNLQLASRTEASIDRGTDAASRAAVNVLVIPYRFQVPTSAFTASRLATQAVQSHSHTARKS